MLASKDPGQLGIYGFRNRTDYSYAGLGLTTSRAVRERRVWDILGSEGLRSIVIGVPGTYPPPTITGELVADFLTPDRSVDYTFPRALKDEIAHITPDYEFDVSDVRTPDKGGVIDRISAMTRSRFRLARHLASTRAWSFFIVHEIGLDRLHHGFWAAMDPRHPRHGELSAYLPDVIAYYRLLGRLIADLIDAMPGGTQIVIASDHGTQTMIGGVRINRWLIDRGYLTLSSSADASGPLTAEMVDWDQTRAWGEGGYYARIFFNLRGREPRGVLPVNESAAFAERLRNELGDLRDHQGRRMRTSVHRPMEIYRAVRGIPPDLIVLFDDLRWRSVGSIGPDALTFENDRGPDDANHSMDGTIIVAANGQSVDLQGASIYDVAPTVLTLLGVGVQADMIGRSLLA